MIAMATYRRTSQSISSRFVAGRPSIRGSDSRSRRTAGNSSSMVAYADPAKFPASRSRPNFSSASRRFVSLGFRSSGFRSPAARRVVADCSYHLLPCGGGKRFYSANRAGEIRSGRFSEILISCSRVLLFLFKLGSWETVPCTNRKRLVSYSRELEMAMGELHIQELRSSLEGCILPVSHPDSVRVCKIAQDIIEAFEREDVSCEDEEMMKGGEVASSSLKMDGWFKWEILVVDCPIPNAYCSLGGKIIVFSGILEHFKSDAEIATIIGHEIGHAVARHNAEMLAKDAWTLIVLVIVYMLEGKDVAEEVSMTFLHYPFSRKMEKEADYISLLLMASAGYDPRVAPTVYEDLAKIELDMMKEYYSSTMTPLRYCSHPRANERSRVLAQFHVMGEALARYRRKMSGLKGPSSSP